MKRTEPPRNAGRSSEVSQLRLGGLVLLFAALVACSGAATPGEVNTGQTAAATSSPEAAARTQPGQPTPSPREIRGLFTDPRPSSAALHRHLGPRPAETFSVRNQPDVVLYDIERRTETDLGPGRLPVFTADGKYLVWASQAGSAQAFEVEGGVQLDLGIRGLPRALTGDRVWVQADDENYEVAIGTGIRRALPAAPAEGVRPRPQDAGRWRLVRVYPPPPDAREPLFNLVDGSGVLGAARFEARSAVLTPDGRLFLATPPVQLDDQAGVIRGLVGWSNVFEVNPETLTASFIASARISQALFPFAANERYVAWTEDFCNIASFESLGRVSSFPDSNGRTRIYDRQSGTLTELDQGLLVDGLTPRGELAIGAFGADALLDLETFAYTVVFPSEDRVWSPDYRYAAVGAAGGHGGYCGAE